MTITKSVLDSLALSLVYSVVIMLIDTGVLLVIYQELTEVVSYLSLVMLAEGGLGLIVGGFIGMNSPIISRIEEDFFHIKPQKPKDRKELEKQAKTLVITGIILTIISLLLSIV